MCQNDLNMVEDIYSHNLPVHQYPNKAAYQGGVDYKSSILFKKKAFPCLACDQFETWIRKGRFWDVAQEKNLWIKTKFVFPNETNRAQWCQT